MQPNHQGDLDADFGRCLYDTLGDNVAFHNSAKDVDQDPLNSLIGENDSEGLCHPFLVGSSTDIQATANDEGTVTLCSAINAGPIDAVHYPTDVAGLGPLSVFDGMDAAGDWTITVTDSFFGDDGTLDQWSLHIVEGNPICEMNVNVCHEPDSNDPHTIVVGQSSVEHHLNHGDTVGPCEGASSSGNGGSFGKNN